MATTDSENRTESKRLEAMRHGLDTACNVLARYREHSDTADERFEELAKLVRRAWKAYQSSGVMCEPDGRTKNAMLDVVGLLLDEAAHLADGVH